jgi:hypothetical protein
MVTLLVMRIMPSGVAAVPVLVEHSDAPKRQAGYPYWGRWYFDTGFTVAAAIVLCRIKATSCADQFLPTFGIHTKLTPPSLVASRSRFDQAAAVLPFNLPGT